MKVLRPRRLDEALALKAADDAAVPVAGATDLWVHWPTSMAAHERTYLDLGGLDELRRIEVEGDTLVLGAGVTYWDVLRSEPCREHLPILLEAARQVGAVQIQARGTWAGNIANASPAADGVAVLMACDAEVVLASARGERRVPLDRYYLDYKVTVAEPDELIRAVRLPLRPYAFARFEKVGARRAQTITKVGVAMTSSAAGWRVVVNSMAPAVVRCPRIEALLAGAGGEGEGEGDFRAALADAIDGDLSPIDDIRSTAAYRRTVCARLITSLAGRGA
jgi:CO/xanthine dehydrogenase FAD-binding subunit